MKLSLVVTQGKAEGKVLPITLPQFIIGRDPQCHLRPASPVISKRHCALLKREGKAFVHDLKSSNGTSINDQRIQGEVEVHDGDTLKIGPLVFTIKVEVSPPVSKPTPMPKKGANEPIDYESVAADLLATDDDGETAGNEPFLSEEEVPSDSTVTDFPVPPLQEPKASEPAEKKKEPPKTNKESTSSAAEALLKKYSRRSRE